MKSFYEYLTNTKEEIIDKVFKYDPEEEDSIFYVCSENYYNKHGEFIDEEIDDSFMPEGFDQIMGSCCFEYNGDIYEGRKKLIALGLKEIK